MVTEIRNFYSLEEIGKILDEEIDLYKGVVEDYSQRLGSLLREMEGAHGNEEWFQKISSLQKSSKKKSRGREKTESSLGWIEFKDILISKEDQGEAQMLFKAIEDMNNKIMRLEKIGGTIENLRQLGLGEDILYITYVRDEVPERIVLRKRGEKGTAKKFEFVTTFSLSKGL